jgi:hypothetical protein
MVIVEESGGFYREWVKTKSGSSEGHVSDFWGQVTWLSNWP